MAVIGGIDLGNLTDYLLFFADANEDANWQGASKGFAGDVAVDGIQANERTSGFVPYAGTITTNDLTLDAWQDIVDDNPLQATGVTGQVALINDLETDLINAFQQINALSTNLPPGVTAPVSSTDLNGVDTTNGTAETFVIDIVDGLSFSSKIFITGDPEDVFILRWDEDPGTPGYQGQVKPQSGGAIVPQGGLEPGNFINVAGDINASGGGTTPAAPYPQGPRLDDGQGALINGGDDFDGGGFFTGYWLTTGSPTDSGPGGLLIGDTSSLSNGIFVGGWYTLTTKFSMTSGTSGVYVSPNPATLGEPSVDVEKFVSPDGGTTFFDADTPPGPNIVMGTDPEYRIVVTNTGNETLTNITLTDDVLGAFATPASLAPGDSFEVTATGTWAEGLNTNTATVTADGDTVTGLTDSDPANYTGVTASIDVEKLVSADGGMTFVDADTPPGPDIVTGTDPVFKYVVTNNGTEILTDISLIDSKLGPITIPTTTLNPGESFEVTAAGTWAEGQQTNTATATGTFDSTIVEDTDPANYFGAANAAIDIEKLVSGDGGLTFFDADTPTGPLINEDTDPQFKFIVTNTGDAPLTDITVTDTVLGFITTIPSLNPGDSDETIVIGTWAGGQQTNTATAEGTFNDQTLTDTDPANYFGIPECFSQLLIDGDLEIPEPKPDIAKIVDFNVKSKVNDIDIFDTVDGTKIIVGGFVKIGITYVADNEQQTEHFAHFRVPFSATLVCPEIPLDAKLEPIIVIEHEQHHIIDERTISKDIVMLVGVIENC
ncbi:DUF3794 domain-containing protein [Acetohalobium arabaticum]|uniref:Conserved repeat domain protein n=1 Tax=Acetohalobium arabaticum (strain ATCC 49924 / DSM 5501 / Z-7288) TaxID=574087 RepID=D9QR81_ACEAZ|nr:DUF3794 domain-containing protein [Acetohalobium arabaticum]ADL13022.1 conserved repeat domain protein [Acetohalobium arabaticum DSM 5501]